MLGPSPFNLPSDDQCRVIYNVCDLQHSSFLPKGCSVLAYCVSCEHPNITSWQNGHAIMFSLQGIPGHQWPCLPQLG